LVPTARATSSLPRKPSRSKQYELDRGQKKADVCRAIEGFLSGVLSIGEARQDLLTPFYRATEPNAVALLFDEDGRAYIAELRAQANKLWSIGMLESGMSDHQKRAQTMKRLHLVGWMGQQLGAELERRLGCRDVRGGSFSRDLYGRKP
jgi:hypothetical protein